MATVIELKNLLERVTLLQELAQAVEDLAQAELEYTEQPSTGTHDNLTRCIDNFIKQATHIVYNVYLI